MHRADLDGTLPGFLGPSLVPEAQIIAQIEGWILGIK